jgi:hypothetical protein
VESESTAAVMSGTKELTGPEIVMKNYLDKASTATLSFPSLYLIVKSKPRNL